MSEHARAEREEAAAAPEPSVTAAAGPPLQALLTRLQRTAGNRAVGRLLAREVAEAPFDAADLEALKVYNDARTLEAGGADAATTAGAKRNAIVKLALSQVGKVRDEDRGDGKKKGAERLKEFYRVACPSYTPAYDYGIERVGMWAGQTPKDKSKTAKPWSWCAIFGVWAIRQVTGIGSFAGAPIGLGPVHNLSPNAEKAAASVQPGDLICRREQYAIEGRDKPKGAGALNHQCLVASVDTSDPAKPKVTTINGNGYYQEIHVRTEPLSYYWGYYDSLSETNVAAYEKTIRDRYGWFVKVREDAGLPGV